MTDKQIIINNIDVSECEHLTETRHCKAQMAVMGTDANKCKCFPNCYYKQLKRKEQECEKYEQTLTEVRKIAQGVRNYLKYPAPKDVRYEMDIILQKISEVVE